MSTPPKDRPWKRVRDAVTGRFATLADAQARPSTTVVQRIPRKRKPDVQKRE